MGTFLPSKRVQYCSLKDALISQKFKQVLNSSVETSEAKHFGYFEPFLISINTECNMKWRGVPFIKINYIVQNTYKWSWEVYKGLGRCKGNMNVLKNGDEVIIQNP